MLGRFREPAHRARHRTGEQEGGEDGGGQRDRGEQQDNGALVGENLVDLARARRQQEHALHRLHPLDGHGHGDDLLALLVEQQHRCRRAGERHPHLRIGGALGGADFAVDRQLLVDQPVRQTRPEVLGPETAVGGGGLGLGADDLAAREQHRRIDDQRAVAAVDAGARVRRLDQPPQDGGDTLRADRQLEGREAVVAERDARVLRLGELVGVEHDALGLEGGVGGDGRGDDLALRLQRVALGIDQPGVVLAEVEDAEQQHAQPDEVGDEDASCQARRDEPYERLPAKPAAGRQRGPARGRRPVGEAVGSPPYSFPDADRRPRSLQLERHSPSVRRLKLP